jgi:hypothetical protein
MLTLIFFLVVVVGLGFELRALLLESTPPVHFAALILEMGEISSTICLGWP